MVAQQLVKELVASRKVELNEQDMMNIVIGLDSFFRKIQDSKYFSFGKMGIHAVESKEAVKKNLPFMLVQTIAKLEHLTPIESRSLRGLIDEVIVIKSLTKGKDYDENFMAATKNLKIAFSVPSITVEFILVASFGEVNVISNKVTFVSKDSAVSSKR